MNGQVKRGIRAGDLFEPQYVEECDGVWWFPWEKSTKFRMSRGPFNVNTGKSTTIVDVIAGELEKVATAAGRALHYIM